MKKRLAKYLIITFTITWFCWGITALLTTLCDISFSRPVPTLLHLLGGFGPTIASFWVLRPRSVRSFVFQGKKGGLHVLLILCLMQTLVLGLSSLELNAALPISLIPLVLLQATLIYGGNEEIGWRGIMQPLLEQRLPFPIATVITGLVWAIWHLPLWFVEGASQQNIPFHLFTAYAILLSFWLSAVYDRSNNVFYCNILHGLSNTLLSVFVIKINATLIIGLLIMLMISICMRTPKWKRLICKTTV